MLLHQPLTAYNYFMIKKQKIVFLIFFLIFLSSRIYVLQNPAYRPNDPKHAYSDVKHDYERYANMWYYGLTPYLKHYFEYPPATIPLILTPLILDQQGIGKYYPNYRFQIFVIDILFFLLLCKVVSQLKIANRNKLLAFVFYTIAGVIAKDFYYEGIDLAFIASLSSSFLLLRLLDQSKVKFRVLTWVFFWLSTAIKFMSLPLMLPLFILRQLNFKKEFASMMAGFLIIWGLPLILFKTSLSVSVVFHLNRHMKFASLPYFITNTINKFTQTETINNQPPDFNYVGPVSTQVETIFSFLMPIAISLVFFWIIKKLSKYFISKTAELKRITSMIFQSKPPTFSIDMHKFLIQTSLIYFFTLFLTGKVFSQPFHIWYIPLLAIFPFANIKKQLLMYILVLWLIIIDTTQLIKFPEMVLIVPLTIDFLRSLLRFVPMFSMLILSFKLEHHKISQD